MKPRKVIAALRARIRVVLAGAGAVAVLACLAVVGWPLTREQSLLGRLADRSRRMP